MLSFGAPWWLAGLLLVPLMRWLHRGGRHRRVVAVARLSLWRGAATHAPAAGERQPPDPVWRRRALLAMLICLALAGPEIARQRARVTLWVDDSLSMLTREDGGTRLHVGIERARALLAEMAPVDVEVRALSNPWRALGPAGGELDARLAVAAGRGSADAPPPALLVPDRQHWLVTDGASEALLHWPHQRRPDRIIRQAVVTRNVGLRRMSARRSAEDPLQFELMIELANGGTLPETRELGVAGDADEVHRSTYRIEPGISRRVSLKSRAAAKVQARLTPGDALAEDDVIELDLAPLRRRRVAVDAGCAPPLVAAIATHPALAPVGVADRTAEAAVDCGAGTTAAGLPTLRVRSDRLPVRPTGRSVRWASVLDRYRRVPLDAESLRLATRLDVQSGDTVLLAVGDAALVVRRAVAPPRVETALDFDATRSADGTTIPLLVNLMFEQLLGEPLLDTIVEVDRGPQAAHVVPTPAATSDVDSAAKAPAEAVGVTSFDAARPLLLLAVLLLLWDFLALARRALRLAPWRRP